MFLLKCRHCFRIVFLESFIVPIPPCFLALSLLDRLENDHILDPWIFFFKLQHLLTDRFIDLCIGIFQHLHAVLSDPRVVHTIAGARVLALLEFVLRQKFPVVKVLRVNNQRRSGKCRITLIRGVSRTRVCKREHLPVGHPRFFQFLGEVYRLFAKTADSVNTRKRRNV